MSDYAAASNGILGPLEQALFRDGLDLAVPCSLATIRLECQGLGLDLPKCNNPLGVFVGNTRALWPRFLAAARSSPDLQKCEHPLDAWVEQRVRLAVAAIEQRATPYFSHLQLNSAYLPLQRWAQAAGAWALSPSYLSVHRDYGPWIALRALVVVDVEATDDLAATPATAPCSNCSAPCRIPFELAAQRSEQLTGARRVTEHWRQWLAVRDACPVGKDFRYGEEQIRYHYARDRKVFGD